MRVTKPISTITYNTTNFLKQELFTLMDKGLISYFEFIEHLPDEDDKKTHIHLYCIPNKALDLMVFADYFIEKDLKNDKPLKCMPFRKSNSYGDWYWYGLHDKDYLKAKGLTRTKFYQDEHIITSDEDFHKTLVLENPLINFAHMSDTALRDAVCNAVYNGESLQALLSSGLVPLGKITSVINFYKALEQCVTPQMSDINTNTKFQQIPSVEQAKGIILNKKISNIKNNPIQVALDDLPFKDDLY